MFPYGQGGFKVARPEKVSYEAHCCWALCYIDKCFCKDFHFIFQVFGVLQKQQLCAVAILQISEPAFSWYKQDIMHLQPSDFENAAAEESAHKHFMNLTIKTLQQDLTTIRVKVMGTEMNPESKYTC